MVGHVGPDRLALEEVHRFRNQPVAVPDRTGAMTLHWDLLSIHRELTTGLQSALSKGCLDSLAIDSWAIDYGLLDHRGRLLGNPVSHRDARTQGLMTRVASAISAAELYETTGVQQLPFNTLYQLVADLDGSQLPAADLMLLIPDLLGFWMTGQIGAEATNASTTQLYDVRTGTWATEIAERLAIPVGILPPLREPGEVIGPLLPQYANDLGRYGRSSLNLVTVGSHDTASAVVAVPFQSEQAAFISSGTWSVVGVELKRPLLTHAAREYGFGNELGVDGRIRFVRNVMGLWVLSETLRHWPGRELLALGELLRQSNDAAPLRSVIDIDHPMFLTPGDMRHRIARYCTLSDQPVPSSPPEVVRCVLESLALAYRRAIREMTAVTGNDLDMVHIVGGGARNALLCQLTADACELPVTAGPVEATALGNILVQARTLGVGPPDLQSMRALVAETQTTTRFEPREASSLWGAAEQRLVNRQPFLLEKGSNEHGNSDL